MDLEFYIIIEKSCKISESWQFIQNERAIFETRHAKSHTLSKGVLLGAWSFLNLVGDMPMFFLN